MNCAKTIQDRPGQPVYEMFGIKRRFQGVRFDPLVQGVLRTSASNLPIPLQNGRFLLLSTNLAREWWQTDTDLLRIYNKHCFPGVATSMTLNDPEPPNFFRYFRLWRTLRV